MDISYFLEPVPERCFAKAQRPGGNFMGETINAYRNEDEFPVLEGAHLVLVGIKEERGAIDNRGCGDGVDYIRKAFYQLFNHWPHLNIVDVGNVKIGKEINDTYFATTAVLTEIVKHKAVPIVIGGGHDLAYSMYQVYEATGRLLNITAVDPLFEIGNDTEGLHSHSYLSNIILHQPNYLFNFINIGYQSYLVSASHIELMKNLLFEAHRLGVIKQNIDLAEPLIRDANFLTVDIAAFRASDAPGVRNASVNGFNGEDGCRMARYAGLSYKLSSIGFFEYNPHYDINSRTANLIAEMIWYFIEGFSLRQNDLPTPFNTEEFTRYLVQIDDWEEDLVFLCHKYTGKWWMDVAIKRDYSPEPRHYYLPCSKEDYDLAMHNELPDKWWQYYQKMM